MNYYAYYLQKILMDAKGSGSRDVLNLLSKNLAAEFCETAQGKILKLAVAEELTQKDLNVKLADIDIEALHADDALLLAYAKKQHKDLDFGEYNEARLSGLMQFYRFNNLNQMVFSLEIVRCLNDNGIIPVASYDYAMKYYRPDCYRILTDAGIVAVSKKQYQRMRQILKRSGYRVVNGYKHFDVVGISNSQAIRVFDDRLHEADWKEPKLPEIASCVEYRGTKYFILSIEDTVALLLRKAWMELRNGSDFRGIAFDMWELFWLLHKQETNISWNRVNEILQLHGIVIETSLIELFMREITADIMPYALSEYHDNILIEIFLRNELNFIRLHYLMNGEIRFKTLHTLSVNLWMYVQRLQLVP